MRVLESLSGILDEMLTSQMSSGSVKLAIRSTHRGSLSGELLSRSGFVGRSLSLLDYYVDIVKSAR